MAGDYTHSFLCECQNEGCHESVRIRLSEWRRHAGPHVRIVSPRCPDGVTARSAVHRDRHVVVLSTTHRMPTAA